jgi:hypothetical protein
MVLRVFAYKKKAFWGVTTENGWFGLQKLVAVLLASHFFTPFFFSFVAKTTGITDYPTVFFLL